MAYNVVYAADGLVKCVSDEYLEHKRNDKKVRVYDKNGKFVGYAPEYRYPELYEKGRGTLPTYAIDDKRQLKQLDEAIARNKHRAEVREEGQKAREREKKAERLSDLQKQAEMYKRQKEREAAAKAIKRKRLTVHATGLKAASGAAVNYLDKNGWTRSRVNPSDGMNKCIFTKTINGRTKTLDIPIAIFEDSLIKRAEQTGFSISKYADAIRSRLKEAKDFDKQR